MAQKGATGDFFFSFLQKKKKEILKMDNIFLPKKIKLRPPDWLQFWPTAGQETDFFYGQPNVVLYVPYPEPNIYFYWGYHLKVFSLKE